MAVPGVVVEKIYRRGDYAPRKEKASLNQSLSKPKPL